jgi:hypothetical protein
MTPPLLRSIAAENGVSVAQVEAMARRILPIERSKRAGQWQLASEARDMQEEGLKHWAQVFGELMDLDERTVYDYAKTWELFYNIPQEDRCLYRFSAWQILARYWDCDRAWETFQEWVDTAKANEAVPRVDTLRAMMSARFGNEPTPQAARAKVGRLYKSLEGLQVDMFNTVPEAAKQELGVAFAAVGRAKKIMEAQNNVNV